MFWEHLPRPFFVLAPMADVTDAAFRRLIAQTGKPHVMWTEFVSADGLYHTRERAHMPDGENPLMDMLRFTDGERPIVAQIFTASPDMAEYAGALVRTLGFDGVDINMGCPDRAVEKQGAGAALIRHPELARELVRALKRGAGSLPVSVKTRIGYNRNELATWLPELLKESPAAITIHARTRKELSLVDARWEHVSEAVSIRNTLQGETLIIGNGDVRDLDDARAKAEASGADGVMLGRAIFGNPWLFSGPVTDRGAKERIAKLIEHLTLWEECVTHKPFAVMKKHMKAYLSGFEGVREFRHLLMEAQSIEEARTMLETWCTSHP